MTEKRTYFRIDFEDCGHDYDYTIVPNISDSVDYLEETVDALDDDQRKAKVIITGIAMTEKEFESWFKENVKP